MENEFLYICILQWPFSCSLQSSHNPEELLCVLFFSSGSCYWELRWFFEVTLSSSTAESNNYPVVSLSLFFFKENVFYFCIQFTQCNMTGKYWGKVAEERRKKPYSILLADKNAPNEEVWRQVIYLFFLISSAGYAVMATAYISNI